MYRYQLWQTFATDFYRVYYYGSSDRGNLGQTKRKSLLKQ